MAEAWTDFRARQLAFSAHLRDPRRNEVADIEDRRLKIYRELFYNNVENCLAAAFPVLRKLSSDAVWHERVRDFYARHRCKAPQFHRLPEEFLRFLEEVRTEHPDDPPFLRELAHYEWVELALSVSPLELSPELADPNGDPLAQPPVISPLAWTLAYRYPVHRIGPDFQPSTPGAEPTWLIVNRDRTDTVRFMQINAVTARLMTLIEARPEASGRDLLLDIAAELAHPDPEAVVAEGAQIFERLRARDILLGTRRPAAG
ncbi:HvfC family RiPP maturation protein [Sinimarinibacterium thermocellulolyticum]|uniref:DNA-binding domain-containing protein n=1 Tax=Sinimarinibacterium thermocellulolyticum TaxID=3170016 RepID=A0ABV2A764_9GAMM